MMTWIRTLRKYWKLHLCIRLFLFVFLVQLSVYLFNRTLYMKKTEVLNDNLIINNAALANFSNASEGEWQHVSGITAFKFLVYSAFLDIRSNRVIRVIAVTKTSLKTNQKPSIWCKFWYQEGYGYTKTVAGNYKIIKEHWFLPYSAYYVTCPVEDDAAIPDAISVLSAPEQEPNNLLKVIVNYDEKAMQWNPSNSSPLVTKMAVCVKPLHYDYNRVIEILEFIELHRIMGANHFFLYRHTVGPQVGCILDKYQEEGVVTGLPWQLPIQSQKEIRTEGIFASLNDCLFRTMHQYSHTIFVDFDEYIVPTNYSYTQLFQYLHDKYDIKRKSVFSFRNAFFYRQWPDDEAVKGFHDPIAEQLIVLRKTTRKTRLHSHRTRSKLIVRPELVNMVGNHFVWEYFDKKGFGDMEVKQEDAFMHHYRVCEFGGDDCVTQPSVVDKTTYKYKDQLVKAVRRRYNKYLKECQLEKISNLKKEG